MLPGVQNQWLHKKVLQNQWPHKKVLQNNSKEKHLTVIGNVKEVSSTSVGVLAYLSDERFTTFTHLPDHPAYEFPVVKVTGPIHV